MEVSVVNVITGTKLEMDKENRKKLPVRKQNLKHNCVAGQKKIAKIPSYFLM